jgi:hypothetical protein
VSETEALFGVLRQSADGRCAAAIEGAVANARDHELCRVNALAFAAKNKLDEERTIAAFLHAARLGLFELSWNVLCPACGGVLDAGTTLKTVNHDDYGCTLCAADYKPTLDEMVEVTFTVSPRVRRIAGHDPDTLPEVEYYREIFWSSGMDLPDDLAASLAEFTIDSIDVPPAAKAVLSVQLPEGFGIVFDPVTHGRQIIAVKGEPIRDRQALQRNEFLRESLHRLHVGRRPASVDPDVAVLRPAELLERLAECSDPSLSFRVALGIGHQHANKPHQLGLLRSCRQRPRRRAADQREELASSWIEHGVLPGTRCASLRRLRMPRKRP